MQKGDKTLFELTNFDAIQIGLASPEKIREWSHGEVKKPETINYRTLKPERDGLFCERIFGPTKDWECHCGRYKRIRYKGVVCEKCGVEVTRAKVRRERMGHIELAAPVSHIWYFKGIPCRMKMLLDMNPKDLEKILYFASFVVTDPGSTTFQHKQLLTDKEYRDAQKTYGPKTFRAGMGAEAIKELLMQIDLEKLEKELREEVDNSSGQKRTNAIKRLEVVEAFIKSGNKPEWIVMDVIPVIPPDLRPMVQLDGGRFATSDLNDLYRRVINRNNRLKRLLELHAPDIIVRNEKRMLQEAVDALIDNGRRGRAVTGPGNRPLKSLSDMLRGKQGRFRQNLLGKRVDYSGRSVIVVGPDLKMYQCGLPKEMALELFKPFVMKKLTEKGYAHNIKSAKRMVERVRPEVWDVLEGVIKDHPVLLNRAPTLHRLGIQAFEPVLVEGRALKLHPLACTAYNADFDGDQMAVHVPLSVEAQAEARFLMLAANNILKPQDGKPVVCPTQDMVMGCYYLTLRSDELNEWNRKSVAEMLAKHTEAGEVNINIAVNKLFSDEELTRLFAASDYETAVQDRVRELAAELNCRDYAGEDIVRFMMNPTLRRIHKGEGKAFASEAEALMAYQTGVLSLHALVKIRIEREFEGETYRRIIKTSIGRLIFNNALPQDLGFVKSRSTVDDMFKLEVDKLVVKKDIAKIVDYCYRKHGPTITSQVLDRVKKLGFSYSTRGGITVGFQDITVPEEKKELLANADSACAEIDELYRDGLLSKEDRRKRVIAEWEKTTGEVTDALMRKLSPINPIYMMANSGARGSTAQIRQLAGMRGLMADPSGQTIEVPIRANFREGLSVLEFFISSHGARKGLADTALRTADSGYLTRRLVDVSHNVIVREQDCFAERNEPVRGMKVRQIGEGEKPIEPLGDRILGRYTVNPIYHPETGELIVGGNEMITYEIRDKIIAAGITEVEIRTVFTCRCEHGVCTKCYGSNLTTGNTVDIGEAVGIIAAQAIGEPGTQLTMRTFHAGGIATSEDITQGLPRVEEIFEARKPKGLAVITEINGVVQMKTDGKKTEAVISNDEGECEKYLIPFGSKLKVHEGDVVEAGDELTEGSVNPHDILKIKGVKGVQAYMLREVQSVYRLQGVEISDKHIEVIIRQMLRKVQVEESGDTDLLPGEIVDIFRFEAENDRIVAMGGTPAVAKRKLLGITKSALATDSFLSAASFQETTRVLTEAAIKGKIDPLVGLKENVILGKLIPAGVGLKRYRLVDVAANEE
ncbi:MAG: DNA-directed RNA polymerase subunit beta' [Clostridia bacterium]|nr:DNA-directed RNA polymerase subunit beta' [Clostridia bacterium]